MYVRDVNTDTEGEAREPGDKGGLWWKKTELNRRQKGQEKGSDSGPWEEISSNSCLLFMTSCISLRQAVGGGR